MSSFGEGFMQGAQIGKLLLDVRQAKREAAGYEVDRQNQLIQASLQQEAFAEQAQTQRLQQDVLAQQLSQAQLEGPLDLEVKKANIDQSKAGTEYNKQLTQNAKVSGKRDAMGLAGEAGKQLGQAGMGIGREIDDLAVSIMRSQGLDEKMINPQSSEFKVYRSQVSAGVKEMADTRAALDEKNKFERQARLQSSAEQIAAAALLAKERGLIDPVGYAEQLGTMAFGEQVGQLASMMVKNQVLPAEVELKTRDQETQARAALSQPTTTRPTPIQESEGKDLGTVIAARKTKLARLEAKPKKSATDLAEIKTLQAEIQSLYGSPAASEPKAAEAPSDGIPVIGDDRVRHSKLKKGDPYRLEAGGMIYTKK